MRILSAFMWAVLLQTSAFALPAGVEMVDITVNGETVSVPIGNNQRRGEIYLLKKALKGDKDAREVFMGGENPKFYYIGADSPLWLKMDSDSEEIVKP